MGILTRYFMKQYLQALAVMAGMLLSLIFFLNLAELFRRTANKANATINIVFSMGFSQMPQTVEVILPFIVLLAGIFTLWRMTRRQEIVIARAAGLSVWHILMPLVGVIILVSVFNLMIFNSLAARLEMTFHRLSQKYISEGSTLDFSSGGLWLRQTYGDGVAVVHATGVKAGPPLQLSQDVMLLFFDGNEHYTGRLDANTGQLETGKWIFTDSIMRREGQADQAMALYELPTTLTPSKIEDSLARPDELSFWQLPGFINALNRTGFSSVRHRTHYQELLAMPLLLLAMLLVAVVFMQRQMRQSQGLMLLGAGVGSGTALFVLNNTMLAFGTSGSLPTILAAWIVPLAACAVALAMLLHLEEGG